MSAPRIIHCAETIKGGIATYLRELIPLQLASFGSGSVIVVIPSSQLVELPVPDGVKVLSYQDTRHRLINAMRIARRTLSAVREYGASVVHVHSTFAGASVRPLIAPWCRSARVVYCAHGWAWDRPMSLVARRAVVLVERTLAGLCDSVVCISEHERLTALSVGLPAEKLVVVRNGVSALSPAPVGPAPPWHDGRLRVLFVGRLDRQKGVDVLFQALHSLGDLVHAVVAGAAVLGDDCAADTPSNVTRIGWLQPGELQTLFLTADVLVVPSRWEGFGLIAAEAMRAGLAVVASDVGGLPEVVADGITGKIVRSESSAALAEAIRALDVEQCRAMGKAGQQRFADLFTMDRVHSELCKVYGLSVQ